MSHVAFAPRIITTQGATMIDRELKPQQDTDRPPTREQAEEIEDTVQERAVVAWRIHREQKAAERLARWRRWAAR